MAAARQGLGEQTQATLAILRRKEQSWRSAPRRTARGPHPDRRPGRLRHQGRRPDARARVRTAGLPHLRPHRVPVAHQGRPQHLSRAGQRATRSTATSCRPTSSSRSTARPSPLHLDELTDGAAIDLRPDRLRAPSSSTWRAATTCASSPVPLDGHRATRPAASRSCATSPRSARSSGISDSRSSRCSTRCARSSRTRRPRSPSRTSPSHTRLRACAARAQCDFPYALAAARGRSRDDPRSTATRRSGSARSPRASACTAPTR